MSCSTFPEALNKIIHCLSHIAFLSAVLNKLPVTNLGVFLSLLLEGKMAFIGDVSHCNGHGDASASEIIASTLCICGHQSITLLFCELLPTLTRMTVT